MDKLPLHPLTNSNQAVFAIEDIAYNNPYNFNEKHRHDYFEIILIENGGGKQWIDFVEIELNDYSGYIILPKQVHLLKREKSSRGILLQFNEDLIDDNILLSKMMNIKSPILFINDIIIFNHIQQYIQLLQIQKEQNSNYKQAIISNQIKVLLYHLISNPSSNEPEIKDGYHIQFMHLIDKHFTEWHTVSEYLNQIPITEGKLAKLTKTHYGQTPLQLIHRRLLLEAKRLLFCEQETIKEIAYQLGFSYPSNFAQFVKNKTGYSASQLLKQIKTNI